LLHRPFEFAKVRVAATWNAGCERQNAFGILVTKRCHEFVRFAQWGQCFLAGKIFKEVARTGNNTEIQPNLIMQP
jgi:hypothetical protein